MNSGKKWKICPLSDPFVVDGKCAKCPKDTPVYNFKEKKCFACENGLSYSVSEKKCAKVCCNDGKYFNEEKGECVCPLSKPHESAEGACNSCILPRYFDEKTK